MLIYSQHKSYRMLNYESAADLYFKRALHKVYKYTLIIQKYIITYFYSGLSHHNANSFQVKLPERGTRDKYKEKKTPTPKTYSQKQSSLRSIQLVGRAIS